MYILKFTAVIFMAVDLVTICCTVRIRFKKLLNKKEIQFKKDLLITKLQITFIDDSI